MLVRVTVAGTVAGKTPVALSVTVAEPTPAAVAVNEPAVLPGVTVTTAGLEEIAAMPEAPLAVNVSV
jgi:hypothetical protein